MGTDIRTITMKTLLSITKFLLVGTGALTISMTTIAGELYLYKESTGSTLLTNKRHNNLQKVKVTYYPDSNIHSYSNWGSSEASVPASSNRSKDAFDHIIQQAAQTHGVSSGLIKAVMHTESGFNNNARSPVGAQGLMQLMPATAKRFNVSNAYDPQQNIMAGARYLAWLLKRFNGNTSLALAGYNAGEGNVSKYGGIPPFRETQDYVRRVTSRYNNLYSGGVSSSGGNLSAGGNFGSAQIIAADYTPTSSTSTTLPPVSPAQQQRYQREIISTSSGSFTDRPAQSYSTNNATASAQIYIAQ